MAAEGPALWFYTLLTGAHLQADDTNSLGLLIPALCDGGAVPWLAHAGLMPQVALALCRGSHAILTARGFCEQSGEDAGLGDELPFMLPDSVSSWAEAGQGCAHGHTMCHAVCPGVSPEGAAAHGAQCIMVGTVGFILLGMVCQTSDKQAAALFHLPPAAAIADNPALSAALARARSDTDMLRAWFRNFVSPFVPHVPGSEPGGIGDGALRSDGLPDWMPALWRDLSMLAAGPAVEAIQSGMQ